MRVSHSNSQVENIPLDQRRKSSNPVKVKMIIDKYNKRISTFLRSNVKPTESSSSKYYLKSLYIIYLL
jgi:hypothetical protein